MYSYSLHCVVIAAAATLVFTLAEPYNSNLGQVVFSHVLFRHGERMPLEFYPNDPYKESPMWHYGLAQLTDVGKQQEFELGLWLRRRYTHMISERYDVDEIHVQSTDADRTLMSAQCCMAGLYQPWEPVPVHTIPVQTDSLLGAASTCPCPVYSEEVTRVVHLPEVQALQNKFQVLYDYVSNHTGNQVQDFAAAIKVYDALAIEEKHNMSVPEWALPIYPEPIREAGLYSFVLPTWTTLLQRLKMGPLLKEMVQHFQDKRAGTLSPDRRLWVYSAHDATIAALLNTFKVFEIHFPPYASCVVLELRLIKEDYFVTLFYRNSTEEEPMLLPIKTCSAVCPLDQFVSLVQPLLPQDWAQECQLPLTSADFCIWPAIIGVTVIVCLVICMTLTANCLKKKPSRSYLTMSSILINTNSKGGISKEQRHSYPSIYV